MGTQAIPKLKIFIFSNVILLHRHFYLHFYLKFAGQLTAVPSPTDSQVHHKVIIYHLHCFWISMTCVYILGVIPPSTGQDHKILENLPSAHTHIHRTGPQVPSLCVAATSAQLVISRYCCLVHWPAHGCVFMNYGILRISENLVFPLSWWKYLRSRVPCAPLFRETNYSTLGQLFSEISGLAQVRSGS